MAIADAWFPRDLPVLEALATAEQGSGPFDAERVANDAGLSALEVALAVDALELGGYVTGNIVRSPFVLGAHVTGLVRLTAAGRRVVGQWPTAESLAERLVQGLEAAAESEPDPVKRGRLKALAVAIATVGRDLVVDIGAAAIAKQSGLG